MILSYNPVRNASKNLKNFKIIQENSLNPIDINEYHSDRKKKNSHD